MPRARSVCVTVAAAPSLLALPAPAPAAEPPNPNDPCTTGTRNTCGTTGVGFYETYRYGTRWFGDFRGLVPGEFHMYCIDLRFWYPGAQYVKPLSTAVGAEPRRGTISVSNLEKAAYAIWTYGRTTANQAAAVMLYASLMGDARPGENPAASTRRRRPSRGGRRNSARHTPISGLSHPASIGVGRRGRRRCASSPGRESAAEPHATLSATGAAAPSTAANERGRHGHPESDLGRGGKPKATTEPVPATPHRLRADHRPGGAN
jgi:hypothetical protein